MANTLNKLLKLQTNLENIFSTTCVLTVLKRFETTEKNENNVALKHVF